MPDGTSLLGNQFTILRRLSAGGFGITYLAKDNTLGRTIVIKECFPDDFCLRDGMDVIARNAMQGKQFRSIVDMFMREARSLAKLRHSNIVGVHRAFEENKTAYMALDLIDGHDLLDIMEASSALLTPKRVSDILVRLLEAVQTIHDNDLLHRDISPDNIIIEKNGTPVLIDFGAARGDASKRTRAISAMLVVKDGYSPQEFYLAGSIQTPSSDLYALASTFYHVLSGEAPPNSQIRMAEVAGQNPDPCLPLDGRIDGYPPSFLRAIDKAMQVLPRDRLQSADDWLEMIRGEAEQLVSAPSAKDSPPRGPISQDLERSLTRLIEETNEEVTKAQSTPTPVVEKPVAAKAKTRIPDWAVEFNEETQEAGTQAPLDLGLPEPEEAFEEDDASEVTAQQRTRVVYTSPSKEKTEPNWVELAMEKRERDKIEREAREREAQEAAISSGGRKPTSMDAMPAPTDPVEARFEQIEASLPKVDNSRNYMTYAFAGIAAIAVAVLLMQNVSAPTTQLSSVLTDMMVAPEPPLNDEQVLPLLPQSISGPY